MQPPGRSYRSQSLAVALIVTGLLLIGLSAATTGILVRANETETPASGTDVVDPAATETSAPEEPAVEPVETPAMTPSPEATAEVAIVTETAPPDPTTPTQPTETPPPPPLHILAAWQLPDMQPGTPEFQYATEDDPDRHDDDMLVPGIQISALPGDQPEMRQIEYWIVAEVTSGTAGVLVWTPGGQMHSDLPAETRDCGELGHPEVAGTALHAAIRTEQVDPAIAEQIALCTAETVVTFRAHGTLSRDGPVGEFLAESTITSDSGEAVTVMSPFEVLPVAVDEPTEPEPAPTETATLVLEPEPTPVLEETPTVVATPTAEPTLEPTPTTSATEEPTLQQTPTPPAATPEQPDPTPTPSLPPEPETPEPVADVDEPAQASPTSVPPTPTATASAEPQVSPEAAEVLDAPMATPEPTATATPVPATQTPDVQTNDAPDPEGVSEQEPPTPTPTVAPEQDSRVQSESTAPPLQIIAAWQLPDMQPTASGIQYSMEGEPDRHDDLMRTDGIQIAPLPDDAPEARAIEYWIVAEAPAGIDDVSGADITVYAPDGRQHVRLAVEIRTCDELGLPAEPGTALETAIKTGQLEEVDTRRLGECGPDIIILSAAGTLSVEDAVGLYRVDSVVADQDGTIDQATTWFENLPITGLEINTDRVDFGTVYPDSWNEATPVAGGESTTVSTYTVRNTGNVGAYLTLQFSPMVGSGSSDQTITEFGAQLDTGEPVSVAANTIICFQQKMEPNEVQQLRLLVRPGTLPADSYAGKLFLSLTASCDP